MPSPSRQKLNPWPALPEKVYKGGAVVHDYNHSRENFNKILDSYLSYVALYKLCNQGSVEGMTPFEEFYWRLTYLHPYADPDRVSAMGY